MNDFEKRKQKIEREFDRTQNLIYVSQLFTGLFICIVTSFVGWVVIKLMQFWGVI